MCFAEAGQWVRAVKSLKEKVVNYSGAIVVLHVTDAALARSGVVSH